MSFGGFGGVGDLGAAGRHLANGFSDLARVSDVVEDALVIATATVRQRVRNRLVVRALRDGGGYDEEWLRMAAALEFIALASEKERDVARLDQDIRVARGKRGRGDHPSDFRSIDVPTLKRRRKTLRRLAQRLRVASEDAGVLPALITDARRDALEDVAAAIRGPVVSPSSSGVLSAPDRAAALAAVLLDLAELAPRGRKLKTDASGS